VPGDLESNFRRRTGSLVPQSWITSQVLHLMESVAALDADERQARAASRRGAETSGPFFTKLAWDSSSVYHVPPVPRPEGTCRLLALGDDALEIGGLRRMVLGCTATPILSRVQAGAHGPPPSSRALHRSSSRKSSMEPGGGVLWMTKRKSGRLERARRDGRAVQEKSRLRLLLCRAPSPNEIRASRSGRLEIPLDGRHVDLRRRRRRNSQRGVHVDALFSVRRSRGGLTLTRKPRRASPRTAPRTKPLEPRSAQWD